MTQNPEKRPNDWTVIVIGAKWGTLSFQVSRFVAVLSVAVAVVCFALAAYGVVHMTNRSNRPSPEEMAVEIKATKESLQSVQSENSRLKAKLHQLENQFISIGQTPPETVKPQGLSTTNAAASSKIGDVSVDQFKIHHAQDGTYHFQLMLKAADAIHDKRMGYFFIILMSDHPENVPDRTYPHTMLKNRKPGNFKEGERFALVRQQMIKGVIKKATDPNLYHNADVLIYSEDGTLLWNRTFSL